MTSMTTTTGAVIGGVDTHGETNHAAVLDELGRQLGDREFPTTPSGYRQLLSWLSSHGQISSIGMEGTGAYGAGLARYLHLEGVKVVEVDRPDRKARRRQGKSDPLDAYAAARAALSGAATGTAKCPVPGLMEALIPGEDESHGSTEEVSRGASGAGDQDGARPAPRSRDADGCSAPGW